MQTPVHPFVEVTNLSRRYAGGGAGAVAALENVSFQLRAGEFAAITGPSGCGKSTLLNLLAALDTPDNGKIKVGAVDLTDADEATRTLYRREQVGIIFQFFNLLPGLTVVENVALPLRLRGIGHAPREAKARELLDFVGLDGRRHHFPHQLSGGEMQRAAVARALVHAPGLIIADEPTGNLDSAATDRVLELFQTIHRQSHVTLVMVTHSERVAAAAPRELRLRDGHLMEDKIAGSSVPGPV